MEGEEEVMKGVKGDRADGEGGQGRSCERSNVT